MFWLLIIIIMGLLCLLVLTFRCDSLAMKLLYVLFLLMMLVDICDICANFIMLLWTLLMLRNVYVIKGMLNWIDLFGSL